MAMGDLRSDIAVANNATENYFGIAFLPYV